MNIIYLRVSKEDETLQDLDVQAIKLKEKYELLKDAVIYKERGSAYNLDKINQRAEFFNVLHLCFDSNKVTIDDIFLGKIKKAQVNIGVWDYARIIRNFHLNLLFSILSAMSDVTIYDYKTGIIEPNNKTTPAKKFSDLILASIQAFDSEQYSYTISQNVKKSVVEIKDTTFSRDGKKWGGQFKDKEEKIVNVTPEEIVSIKRRIQFLIAKFEKEGKTRYYPELIEIINKEKGIQLSASYISRCKNDKD